MSKKQLRKGHRQKLNNNTSIDSFISGLFLLLGGFLIIMGCSVPMIGITILGALVLIGAMPFFLFSISYSVLLEQQGIRFQVFFVFERFYQYNEIESYRANSHYTYLYPHKGFRIRLKNEDCEEIFIRRLLSRLQVRGNCKKRKGASDSRLFWGNCSRPVQMTLFCGITALVSLIGVGVCIGFLNTLSVSEKNLTERVVDIREVTVDPELEDVILTSTDGEVYTVDAFMSSYLPSFEKLTENDLRIYINDSQEVCALYERFGNRTIFTAEQYKNECLAGSFIMLILFAVVALLHPAFLTTILLAYRNPEKHPRLYEHWETENLWSRH